MDRMISPFLPPPPLDTGGSLDVLIGVSEVFAAGVAPYHYNAGAEDDAAVTVPAPVADDSHAAPAFAEDSSALSLLAAADDLTLSGADVTTWRSRGAEGVDLSFGVGVRPTWDGSTVRFTAASGQYGTGGSSAFLQFVTRDGVFTIAGRLEVQSVPAAVSGWHSVILATRTTARGIIVGLYDNGGTPELACVAYNSAGAELHRVAYALPGAAPLALDWVWTGDGATATLYVAGVSQDTDTISVETGAHQSNLVLGRLSASGAYLDAELDALAALDSHTPLDYLAGVRQWTGAI